MRKSSREAESGRVSKYFEDVFVGETVASETRRLTESDFLDFARVSGDYTPIHLDKDFAKSSRFGERIAHGLLIISAAVGLLSKKPLFNETVLAVKSMKIDFLAPVHLGDTIQAELVIEKKNQSNRRASGLVKANVAVRNQREERVVSFSYEILVKTRENQ